MTTGTIDHTPTRTDAPFESVRRRLLEMEGTVAPIGTAVGDSRPTFGGVSIDLLARRYGMAAGAPATATATGRHRCHGRGVDPHDLVTRCTKSQ